jgi:KaiC/GvpD/RAD55 family RecA-like ATPase
MICEHCGATENVARSEMLGLTYCGRCFGAYADERLSEPSDNGAGSDEGGLPWRWAHEITADAPATPDWLYEDFLAPGDKVMYAGQPKVGKTTLVAALIQAIAGDEQIFLGRIVRGGAVVLVSEEGDMTLAPKLRGMPQERVRVLNRDAAWPKPPWAELIAGAIKEAVRIDAVMLVVDSVSFWAQFEGSAENESGTAQAVMDVLDGATRAGLVVFLVHHQRRDGGGPRGSGALMGAVDTVIEYERLEDDAPTRHRRLVTASRWPQTPHVLVVELDQDGEWRLVGEADSRLGSEVLGVREQILAAVPALEPGATEAELVELLGKDKRKFGGPLRKLVDDGDLKREGRGVSGSPYTYWRPSP